MIKISIHSIPKPSNQNPKECPACCVIQLAIDRPNYAFDAPLAFPVPFVVVGIGIGPPGEFSFRAVKTSTPVSVTSKVCSMRMLALDHKREMIFVHTKLSSPLAINSYICPLIRPIDLPRLPKRKDGLDCESHSGFAYSCHPILRIMRYPRWGMEFGVDAMAAPGRDDTAVPGLRMLLDDATKLSYWGSGLHELNCHIQAFPRRFNYSNRVRVCLGSIAHIICFVDICVITLVI